MNREQTLKKAIKMVTGHREEDYGSPEDSFDLIARLWGDYLNRRITAVDVSAMMGLLKIARIGTGRATEDSFVDLAGYAACGCEIATRDRMDYDIAAEEAKADAEAKQKAVEDAMLKEASKAYDLLNGLR